MALTIMSFLVDMMVVNMPVQCGTAVWFDYVPETWFACSEPRARKSALMNRRQIGFVTEFMEKEEGTGLT